jgi:hypothetical protein
VDLSPSNPLPAEWNLVVAASSPEPRAVDLVSCLVEKPVDWDLVLRLANHHGASSLLYKSLGALDSNVPTTVLAMLRQKHESNIHRSLFIMRELIRIVNRLDSLGIEVTPYKGVVLSEVYYGDMAMRQSGDMDLFVHVADVPRIKSAVRDLGYTPRVPIPVEAEADYLASGYECTFDSPAGKNLLEVQWALQPRFYAVDFDMDGLFERAVTVNVGGRRLKTPSPEDLLLVLALHAAKHVWGRLIWMRDIAQTIKREDLNWNWIYSQSRALGIERIVNITLLLTARFLGVALPAAIEKTLVADDTTQALARQISATVAAGVTYEEEKLSYFRLMMSLRERKVDRLRFLSRLAFTPAPGEWKSVRLPKPWFPLYRLVRLARLLSRFAG